MSIFIVVIGILNGALFNRSTESFLPYLCVGYIFWEFMNACINESTRVFTGAEHLIRQMSLPLSFHVFRHVTKNSLILLHNLLPMVIVLLLFDTGRAAPSWVTILGVTALMLNMLSISLFLGVITTRYRDLEQLVKSVMQILFFFTPIFWPLEALPTNRLFLIDINPFYYLIESIRGPLLGHAPAASFWLKLFFITVCNAGAAMWIFSKKRNRIAYWL